MTTNIDTGALMVLRNTKHRLSKQQYKTLRGQVFAGDPDGAMRGLRNILQRRFNKNITGDKKMKANTPKAWDKLPPSQKKQIEEYALKIAREQNEKDGRIMLDLYMKMVCAVLHDTFGFGEKRLYMFLGGHYTLFREQRDMVIDGTQLEYLNRRMDEIFRKSGFPQDFCDKMLGPVQTEPESQQ